MLGRNRWLVILSAALFVAAWTFGSACHVRAEGVTLDLKDVDVTTAIESLFKGSGKNYVIEPGVYGRIPTLSIKDVEFDAALKIITKTAGLVYRIDQGTYMIGLKPVASSFSGVNQLNPTSMGQFNNPLGQNAATTTTTKPSTLEKFKLTYSGPEDILDYIGGNNNNNNNNNNNDNYNNNNNNNNSNYNNNNSSSGSSRSNRSSNRSSSSSSSSNRRSSSSRNSSSSW